MHAICSPGFCSRNRIYTYDIHIWTYRYVRARSCAIASEAFSRLPFLSFIDESIARISSTRLPFPVKTSHSTGPSSFCSMLWLTDINLGRFIYIISSRASNRRQQFSRSNVETRSLRLHHRGSFPLSFSRSFNGTADSNLLDLAKFPEGECRNVDRPSILDDHSLSCDQRRTILPAAVARVTIHRATVHLVILIIYLTFRILGKSKAKSKSTRFPNFLFLFELNCRKNLHTSHLRRSFSEDTILVFLEL